MGIYNKFLDFIGIEEAEEKSGEDLFAEPAEPVTHERSSRRKEQRLQGGGETVPMPNVNAMKMIVYHPVSYEDAQNIIDNLKARKPVIVNMEELEVSGAQRILDFLSGAVYALNGTICKISRGIFVVAPNNYDVVGNGDDEFDNM